MEAESALGGVTDPHGKITDCFGGDSASDIDGEGSESSARGLVDIGDEWEESDLEDTTEIFSDDVERVFRVELTREEACDTAPEVDENVFLVETNLLLFFSTFLSSFFKLSNSLLF